MACGGSGPEENLVGGAEIWYLGSCAFAWRAQGELSSTHATGNKTRRRALRRPTLDKC